MPDLDPDQSAAVDAGPCDVFVAAGAGSGKTRVLTARFVSAVLGDASYRPCDPCELLTVTFTDKAAGELAERIRRALVSEGDVAAARSLGDAWISTIHSMCARILRQHAFAAGLDPYFRLLDEVEASALEARALESAIQDFLASDPRAPGLFDAYGFEAIATAVQRVSPSVRALGLTAADIRTLEAGEALGALRACMEDLSELVREIGALDGPTTVETNVSVTRCAAETIAEALAAGSDGAADLLERLEPRGLRRLASVEGLNELVDEVAERIDRARTAAAQLLVGQHEAAFLAVLIAFEERYAELKRARGLLDFSDLETETLHLLESRPEIAEEYRSRFAMLMLDEFQDTNALQARIVALLSRGNLCTVGDENQSIYGFRHADVGVFRERGERVGDHHRLDLNYRSAPVLLEVVNGLFGHPALLGPSYMALRAPEGAAAGDGLGGLRRFQARFIDWSDPQGADPQEIEAACIADRVAEYLDAGVQPGKIAVLMRALAGGRGSKVERALTARGIPVYLASGGAFFECPEVIEARALLRVIHNVHDDAAAAIVLGGRLCSLSADSLVAVREYADRIATSSGRSRRDVHLWDALTDPGLDLPEADAYAASRVVAAVSAARDRGGVQPLGEVVLRPLLALDADLVLFAAGAGGARAWSNILKLSRIAADYEAAFGGDLASFLGYLELRELYATSEQEATLDGEFDAVRVMSIHASKGLEFPVVIVGGLTGERDVPGIAVVRIDGHPLLGMKMPADGEMLHTMASQMVKSAAREAAEAEAVRLLYVGCTRAMEALTVVSRTNPAKEADDSLGGRVRRALGLGAEGALHDGAALAAESAEVRLLEPDDIGREAAMMAAATSATPSVVPPAPAQPASMGAQPGGRAASPPRRVSYTGLATYERCAYRFFLTSVMRLPAPPSAQGGDALVFGSAVHAVLEQIRSLEDDPAPLVTAVAKRAGLDRQAAGRLERAVRAYLASETAAEVYRAQRVMRETPIAVPVGGTVLAGAIDAIAWNGDAALIVDYKSGTGPLTPDEALDRYRLQGRCYALAAFGAGASSVRVVFFELERDRTTTYTYERAERASIESSVSEIIERMSARGFAEYAGYDRALCETCPGLGGMCPVTRSSGDAAG